MTTTVLFMLLFTFLFLGMPIAIALGLSIDRGDPAVRAGQIASLVLQFFQTMERPLLAIPFFILAGNFLTTGGVAKRMINFADVDRRASAGWSRDRVGHGLHVLCGRVRTRRPRRWLRSDRS